MTEPGVPKWEHVSVGPSVRRGLAALLLLGALVGCEYRSRTDDVRPLDSLRHTGPSQVTWDAQFAVTEEGRRRAVIRADKMEQYRTPDSSYSVWQTLSDTGRVHTYVFEEGDSSATVIADSVRYYNANGRYEAYGNVTVQTQSGRRLESEHLTWDQFDRTIRTRRFVEITTPTEIVRGNGLVADEDLETYQIGQFTAQVEVDDDTTR
ncbi:MAG: LPS export ABC transporter periplasmic protein LptC [Bacteroidetes bacterium SW_9_63_38]|nr:MAG: LPS export ABC transporter periplasmic protein LptC [Bacteroidetes bacterium SW_9_63_38]